MIGNMAQQSHSSCVGKYLFSDPCEWLTMGKSPWRLHALQNDLELLVIRPASTSAGINDSQPFNLSTVLIAVHKDCYTALTLSRNREERLRREVLAVANSLRMRSVLFGNELPVLGKNFPFRERLRICAGSCVLFWFVVCFFR